MRTEWLQMVVCIKQRDLNRQDGEELFIIMIIFSKVPVHCSGVRTPIVALKRLIPVEQRAGRKVNGRQRDAA